jgi:hypothetical protein
MATRNPGSSLHRCRECLAGGAKRRPRRRQAADHVGWLSESSSLVGRRSGDTVRRAHATPGEEAAELTEHQSLGRTNLQWRTSYRGMVRTQIVVSAAVALLFAGACQEERGSDERSAIDADMGESAAPCSVESVPRKSEAGAVAFAYGEGPVFVGLGTGDGVVRYTVDTKKHNGWYYYKTLWAIAPSYTGSVVVTGKELGGSSELRFNAGARFPGQKQLELRFPADDSGKWRYGPSDTLIRAGGCYVFRVEGDDFEQDIAFKASG